MASASWCGAMARGVRLFTRNGNDFRFPLAVEAVAALSARSFLLDGEAIVTNERGLAVFDLIRHQRHGDDGVLLAFDLIELDGEDLRRTPRAAQAPTGQTGTPSAGRDCRERGFRGRRRPSCSRTPVSSVARASSQSGSAHFTNPGARRIG